MARPINPNKPKTTTISCKFEDSLLEKVDSLASKSEKTRSDIIKEACEFRVSAIVCPVCGALNSANAVVCGVCRKNIDGVEKQRQRYAERYDYAKSLLKKIEKNLSLCYVKFEIIGAYENKHYDVLKDTVNDLNIEYSKKWAVKRLEDGEFEIENRDCVKSTISSLSFPTDSVFDNLYDYGDNDEKIYATDDEKSELIDSFSHRLEVLIHKLESDCDTLEYAVSQIVVIENGGRPLFPEGARENDWDDDDE